MDSDRRTATIVGVLFIVATVTGVISVLSLGSILDTPDHLTAVSDNQARVIVGAFFYFIMAVAIPAIAIVIYPILRRHNEVLALGYVGARIAEGFFFVVEIISILTVLTLSHQFAKAGVPDVLYVQSLGALSLAAGDWAYLFGFGVFFTLSALILNSVLYRSRLVPRWLSGCGLIGAILIIAHYLLLSVGSSALKFLFVPIAVQEMVFAVWLILRGFSAHSSATQ